MPIILMTGVAAPALSIRYLFEPAILFWKVPPNRFKTCPDGLFILITLVADQDYVPSHHWPMMVICA